MFVGTVHCECRVGDTVQFVTNILLVSQGTVRRKADTQNPDNDNYS